MLALAVAVGCSVDEFSNPQRKTTTECARDQGSLLEGKFCVPEADPPNEQRCTEEGAMEPCYEGADPATSLQPPCRAGGRTCRDGAWSSCEQQVLPEDETCNGTDDDCDGRVDEHIDPAPCGVDSLSGVCARGVQLCLAGDNQCVQVEHPSADVCNDEDDDCDGQIDEATARPCYDLERGGCQRNEDGNYTCQGTCTSGEFRCVAGEYASTCDGSVTPAAEELCSSGSEPLIQDEDCDGQIDEGCQCLAGAPCYTGSPATTQNTGPCHAGKQTCSDATHGLCNGEVKPAPEDCSNEGHDDDCDGVMDNVLLRGQPCADTSNALGACKTGAVWDCTAGKPACIDAKPAAEICDSVDNDCDSHVDEGFVLDSDPKNCGKCGNECGQGLVCCSGSCIDTKSSNLHCNGCGLACDAGKTCCGGMCFNTAADINHCGHCDTVCERGLLSTMCAKSVCRKL